MCGSSLSTLGYQKPDQNHAVTQNVTTHCSGGYLTINTGTGATGSGFSPSDYYWSSSEANRFDAHDQDFGDGNQTGYYKLQNDDHVRPVWAF